MFSNNKLRYVFLFVLGLNLIPLSIKGQEVFDLAAEVQLYPTGFMPGLRGEIGFQSKNAVHVRLGYNLLDHGDAGVHEDEKGGGPGFSIGYKRYFGAGFRRWYVGPKIDWWFNSVDWKDNIGLSNEISGNTDVVVFQPTVEFGYAFLVVNEHIIISPNFAVGYEINVITEGEPTGEGAILLLGILIGKRF